MVALTQLSLRKLERADFERLLGPLKEIIDRDRLDRESDEKKRIDDLEVEGLRHASRKTIEIEACLHVTPEGGVYLAKHASTGREYTLVVETKISVLRRESAGRTQKRYELLRSLKRERNALLKQNEFAVPELVHAFADDCNVYSLLRIRLASSFGSSDGWLEQELLTLSLHSLYTLSTHTLYILY